MAGFCPLRSPSERANLSLRKPGVLVRHVVAGDVHVVCPRRWCRGSRRRSGRLVLVSQTITTWSAFCRICGSGVENRSLVSTGVCSSQRSTLDTRCGLGHSCAWLVVVVSGRLPRQNPSRVRGVYLCCSRTVQGAVSVDLCISLRITEGHLRLFLFTKNHIIEAFGGQFPDPTLADGPVDDVARKGVALQGCTAKRKKKSKSGKPKKKKKKKKHT